MFIKSLFNMNQTENKVATIGSAAVVGGIGGAALWTYVGSVAATGSLLAGYAAVSTVAAKVLVVGGTVAVIGSVGSGFIRGLNKTVKSTK